MQKKKKTKKKNKTKQNKTPQFTIYLRVYQGNKGNRKSSIEEQKKISEAELNARIELAKKKVWKFWKPVDISRKKSIENFY